MEMKYRYMYVGKLTRTIKRYAVVVDNFVENENGTYNKETEVLGIVNVLGNSIPRDSVIRKNFDIPADVKFSLVEENEGVYEAFFVDIAPFFHPKSLIEGYDVEGDNE